MIHVSSVVANKRLQTCYRARYCDRCCL